MDYANVIPIDADVARLLERRRTRFRWLVCAVASVWLAVLVPTILFTPLPPIGAFAVLAVLVVLAEHRFVAFGDETSMSASIIVVIASVFVFADSSPLAGPMLIASLGGLYFPLLRARAFAKTTFNCSSFSLAAYATSLAVMPVEHWATVPRAVPAAFVACGVYWCVNSILTGCASALCLETRIVPSIVTQMTSAVHTLLLAAAAGLVGIRFVGNIAVCILLVLGFLLIFETYVRQTPRARPESPVARTHALAAIVGLSASLLHTGLLGVTVALVGAFLVLTAQGGPLTPGERVRGLVITYVGALLLAPVGIGFPLQFVVCTVLGLLYMSLQTVDWKTGEWRLFNRWLVALGLALPSRWEFGTACALTGALWATHDHYKPSFCFVALLVLLGLTAGWYPSRSGVVHRKAHRALTPEEMR